MMQREPLPTKLGSPGKKKSVISANAGASVRKPTRGTPLGKKPADMPRRPLSGYNFFFKDQRKVIMAERVARKAAGGSTEKDLFSALGRTVAARWKQTSAEEKERYAALAADDLIRYRREMEEYNDRIAKRTRRETEAYRQRESAHAAVNQVGQAPAAFSFNGLEETGSPLLTSNVPSDTVTIPTSLLQAALQHSASGSTHFQIPSRESTPSPVTTSPVYSDMSVSTTMQELAALKTTPQVDLAAAVRERRALEVLRFLNTQAAQRSERAASVLDQLGALNSHAILRSLGLSESPAPAVPQPQNPLVSQPQNPLVPQPQPQNPLVSQLTQQFGGAGLSAGGLPPSSRGQWNCSTSNDLSSQFRAPPTNAQNPLLHVAQLHNNGEITDADLLMLLQYSQLQRANVAA